MTAERLADEGAVVVVTDVQDEAGEQTTAAIRAAGGDALYINLDVTGRSRLARRLSSAYSPSAAGWTSSSTTLGWVSSRRSGENDPCRLRDAGDWRLATASERDDTSAGTVWVTWIKVAIDRDRRSMRPSASEDRRADARLKASGTRAIGAIRISSSIFAAPRAASATVARLPTPPSARCWALTKPNVVAAGLGDGGVCALTRHDHRRPVLIRTADPRPEAKADRSST